MTATYVALLRGINLGKRQVPMEKFRALLGKLGGTQVESYIASGNGVFRHPSSTPDKLAAQLADLLEKQFGFAVPVVLRDADELAEVLRHNPFLDSGIEPRHLHVCFLGAKPAKGAEAKIDPQRSPQDRFVLRGRDLYLHLPKGAGESRLTPDYLEKQLATMATARNWNTVGKLAEMSRRIAGS